MRMRWFFATIAVLCLATSNGATSSTHATAIDTYPIWLRLRFDKDSSDAGYLWERRVLSDLCRESSWAEESTATDRTWRPVDELPRRVKVGLALGGGVVRGIGHVGVLRALEENNIAIHGIAGTSMGAIIGGLYASGYSVDSLESVVRDSIDWKNLFSDQPSRQSLPMWVRLREKPREPGLDIDIDFKLSFPCVSMRPDYGAGLRAAQKFTDAIAERTLEADYRAGFKFDSLPIPFGAMLTNMNTGQSELKRKGTISTAARASGSFPMAFEPMKIGDTPYIDGGVLDNLPVDAFIRFDTTRAPDNMMDVIGKDTINYVIAVYPSKRRGVREAVEKKPELSAPLGIAVMNRASSLARDYHVWNSWDAAHAKIDIDVEGGFDFSPEKLKEVISAGYCAAWKQISKIKKEIAAKEDAVRSSEPNQPEVLPPSERIRRLASIKLLSIMRADTTEVKESNNRQRILRAIRLKEGSHIEKIDICDAVKRIYDLGDFQDVEAKIDNADSQSALTFFLEKKKSHVDSVKVIVKMGHISAACDSLIRNAVKQTIREKKRSLNFDEIKDLMEGSLVEQGFVSPRVDSLTFSATGGGVDKIYINGHQGTYLRRLKITFCDTKTRNALENEFEEPFSPTEVLKKAKYLHKEFQLRTISVEDREADSLVIAVAKKSNATLELPSLTLEIFEGINFFTEVRFRGTRGFPYSFYLNYAHNFPTKMAQQLPKGHRYEAGLQRCASFSWRPEGSLSLLHLELPGETDAAPYDKRFHKNSLQLALPVYWKFFPVIPGFELAWLKIDEKEEWHREGGLWIRYDYLDRIIFPESGWKLDIDAKLGEETKSWCVTGARKAWSRARVRLTAPWSYRIQNIVTTTLSLHFFGSWYDEGTPDHERFSLGGLTPVGSYQLRPLDSEDLPGFKRDRFLEPLMYKAGAKLRFALLEKEPLGITINIHFEGSGYTSGAAPDWDSLFSDDRRTTSGLLGLYIDTSLLNIGVGFKGSTENVPRSSFLRDNIYLSVVLYGLAF